MEYGVVCEVAIAGEFGRVQYAAAANDLRQTLLIKYPYNKIFCTRQNSISRKSYSHHSNVINI